MSFSRCTLFHDRSIAHTIRSLGMSLAFYGTFCFIENVSLTSLHAEEKVVSKAFIDGIGPDWRTLGEND
ncbi:MAG: hypothetical protein NTX02_01165, partial [Planctomycetia bacterium]|nr:hypothetical protein [Planctomycetia bacterium]